MVVNDARGCHSDRDTVSSHFCQGSFNQRLRGDCRSLKDLLSALGSIGVDPRLLQNAALGVTEINGNHEVAGTCIVRVIFHIGFIFYLSRGQAGTSSSSGWARYSSLISLGPKGQVCSTKRAQRRYATPPAATQASESNMGSRPDA